MAGPYEKFETAFETFQHQLSELLTTKQQELLEAIRSVPPPQPAPAPNPLAFYETILRVECVRQYGVVEEPPVRPYFADVFNDVLRYFGGSETTDPLGKKFLEEAPKRFAYLLDPDLKETLLFPAGMVRRTFAHKEEGEEMEHTFIDFDERDFAVLRQLLEDIFKEQEPEPNEEKVAALPQAIVESTGVVVAKEPQRPKQVISSDLADVLKKG